MKYGLKAIHFAFLIFVFLLPLKFTRTVGLPSVPTTALTDFGAFLYSPWSTFAFTLFSAIFLLLYLPHVFLRKDTGHSGNKLLWILGILTVLSFCGLANASCQVYVSETLLYVVGGGAFACAVCCALKITPEMKSWLLYAISFSSVFAALIGWDQHFSALQMTRDFVQYNGLSVHLSESMVKQLNSTRIFGPFQICNTYAAFLAATLPVTLFCVYDGIKKRFGSLRAYPLILSITLAAVSVFLIVPLWLTGSRGALLALFCAGALLVPFCVQKRSVRLFVWFGYCLVGLGFLCYMILFYRSPLSVLFRLDYDFAAARLMFKHPFAGAGWGEFFLQYPQLKLLVNDETPHSPHNILMFFGSQAGIAAFLAAVCFLAYPVFSALRVLWRKNRTKTSNLQKTPAFDFPGRNIVFLSLLTLSFDFLFEIGVEVPACFACLIILGLLTVSMFKTSETPCADVRKCAWMIPVIASIFAIGVAGFSVRASRAEFAFSDLYEKTNPYWGTVTGQQVNPQNVDAAFRNAEKHLKSPYVYATMARYCLRQGDCFRAAKCMDSAIALCPNDSSLYRLRLSIDVQMEDKAAAERDFAMLKKLEPKNPKLPETMNFQPMK